MLPKHGTIGRYNKKCRCVKCRKANAKQHQKYMLAHPEQQEKARLRSRSRYGLDPNTRRPPVIHGTLNGVKSHKRRQTALCGECKEFVKADRFLREMRHKQRLAPCGTPAALRRHYRNKEPIDELCRRVFNMYERNRRKALSDAQNDH